MCNGVATLRYNSDINGVTHDMIMALVPEEASKVVCPAAVASQAPESHAFCTHLEKTRIVLVEVDTGGFETRRVCETCSTKLLL